PDSGEGIHESEIVTWDVKPGDQVEEDDTLAEIQSDKAVVALPSPVSGVVKKLLFEEGDVPKVGETIVEIEISDEAAEKVKQAEGNDAVTDVTMKNGTDTVAIESEDVNHLKPTELPESSSEQSQGAQKPASDVDIRMLAIPAVRKYA